MSDDRTPYHSREACHPPCPIHAPSDHHMAEWPMQYKYFHDIFERTCPHGVGHPDPDSLAYKARLGSADGLDVHGCDGCCTPPHADHHQDDPRPENPQQPDRRAQELAKKPTGSSRFDTDPSARPSTDSRPATEGDPLGVRAALGAVPGSDSRLATERIARALDFAVQYGGIDDEHHKAWVIDQMCRALAGDDYPQLVRDACNGENGPGTYTWDEGVAP